MIDLKEKWAMSFLNYDSIVSSQAYRWNHTRAQIEARAQDAKILLAVSLLKDVTDALASAQGGERVSVPYYTDFLEALTFLNIAQTRIIINDFLQMPIRNDSFIDVGVEEREDEGIAANNVEDTQGTEFIEENAMRTIFEDDLVFQHQESQLWSQLSADQCIAIITALHPYDANNNNALPDHQKAAIEAILDTCNPPPSAEQLQLINQHYGLNMQALNQPDLRN